jgi:hypothetical protein
VYSRSRTHVSFRGVSCSDMGLLGMSENMFPRSPHGRPIFPPVGKQTPPLHEQSLNLRQLDLGVRLQRARITTKRVFTALSAYQKRRLTMFIVIGAVMFSDLRLLECHLLVNLLRLPLFLNFLFPPEVLIFFSQILNTFLFSG